MRTYTYLKLLVSAMLCYACSNETEIVPAGGPEAPLETAAVVKSVSRAGATSEYTFAPAGTYYLGYPVKFGTSPLAGVVNGTDGVLAFDPVPAWWIVQNAQKPEDTPFTLDNVAPKPYPAAGSPGYDILWGRTTGWITPLNFVLEHRMAMVSVTLNTAEAQDNRVDLSVPITISLDGIARTIRRFDRTNGTVTAGDKNETLPFETDRQTTGSYQSKPILLPPQERNDASRLTISVGEGNDRKNYECALPEGMVYDDDHHSRTLAFLAGYQLKIEATLVKNLASWKISFVAATLDKWVEIGTATVGAKVAGIYSEEDLKAWAQAYNSAIAATGGRPSADAAGLERFGKWTGEAVDAHWEFSIWESFEVTGGYTPVTTFYDVLEGHNYTLTGISSATGSGSDVICTTQDPSAQINDVKFNPSPNP